MKHTLFSLPIKYFLGVVIIVMGVHLTGCMNLDSFIFKGEEVDEYFFDNYSGGECSDAIDSLGKIDPTFIEEMPISSGNDKIACVLVGEERRFTSTDTLILYIHGTSLHIDHYWARTRLLVATGFPVFTFDFRGYGKSTGTPTETGIYEDGYACLKYIASDLGNPNVVVYAYSIGTLVGCEIAARDSTGKIIALILEAPINSVETLIQDATYLNLPGNMFSSYEGNNGEKITEVNAPLLWLHGTDDETVTFETNGKKVFGNYTGDKGYSCIVDGAGHRTVPSTIGYRRYIDGMRDFIIGHASDNTLFSAGPQ